MELARNALEISMAKKTPERALSILEIAEILERAPDVWLTDRDVAAITGLSTAWLASAREGRAATAGPPCRKLGDGRTAPVRYAAGLLREWMHSFPLTVNTSGAAYDGHADFIARAAASESWLYAENRSTLERLPLARAVELGVLGEPGYKLAWVEKRHADTWPCNARLSTDAMHTLRAAGLGVGARDMSAVVLSLIERARTP